MTDIFHEVEDDLRKEKAAKLWRRFGPYLLAAAVLVVLATAAWRGWVYWRALEAAATGDRFVAALQLADDGKHDDAMKALADLSTTGTGGYPILAQLRSASELAGAGKTDEAVKAFDDLAASPSTPPLLKALSRLRAALLLVDSADLAAMKTRIGDLASTGGPWRNASREILGLTAWRAGDVEAARGYFNDIAGDPTASDAMKNRVQLMLELIKSKAGEPAPAAKS
ncbi:hypothetical protein C3941_08015 [Kaistia algarum]|uniref:tetratricopeptide repeat protein n=1 Tax=Kaistia algarum TaxID=2083279 RepID=UPI000CE7F2B6|nr:tetratricopeptide repeat protein [Kaistia algarum]MCX5512002.1 tetratricopeptide repeat protein [Kaistia algarum]PPE80130.1 hypothetical protein C3941_08015 [Kaistia algarum]